MLVPLSASGSAAIIHELPLRIVSPEGRVFGARFPADTLLEEVRTRAVDHLYEGGGGAARYRLVHVSRPGVLRELMTLAAAGLVPGDELLLVERRATEPQALAEVAAARAPAPAAVAAATAALPAPPQAAPQPNLQALLSTNELSHELRKILIALVEAGARLAASSRNYRSALAQLSAALDEARPTPHHLVQVVTPEDIAARLEPLQEEPECVEETAEGGDESRAELLRRFLEKFRAWRGSVAAAGAAPEGAATLRELGFSADEAAEALAATGGAVPAAAAWLLGERGASVRELVDGLPEGGILDALLAQATVQRGLLNTRMLLAFLAMAGRGAATLWLSSPHTSPLLSQISRTYHSEKYCLAVNQFSQRTSPPPVPTPAAPRPSTSRARR